MNKIIKFLRFFLIFTISSLCLFIIGIQFQYTQNFAVNIISKIIKEKTNIDLTCKSFNIKSIFDFEIHDIKLTNENEKNFIIELDNLVINLNPFNLLFYKTVNVNNLLIKNVKFKINIDNIKKNLLNKKNIEIKKSNYNINSKQIELKNLTIILQQNNKTEEYIISTLVENLEINSNNINSKIISFNLKNRNININDLKTEINYFFKTNTLFIRNIEVISKYLYLNSNIFISNLNNLMKNGIINYDDKIKFKINKLKIPLKLIDNDKLINLRKYLTNLNVINTEIILENNNIKIKNGNILYLNNIINLDININNIKNKNKINYTFYLKNDIFRDNIIKKITEYDLEKMLDLKIKNFNFKITGNLNNIFIQSYIYTSITDIFLNTLIKLNFDIYYLNKNLNNILKYIKSNITFKNINFYKLFNGLNCKLLNVNLFYDSNTNTKLFDIKINNINYKNTYSYNINYKNNIINNEIKGILNIFDNNINITANTYLNYLKNNLNIKIDGDINIKNFFLKNLKINDLNCKLETVFNKNNDLIKITNSLKNINFKKLKTNITTNDINTTIDINNENIIIKTICDFLNSNIEINKFKNLITNIKNISKLKMKKNKNVFDIIKDLNNFEESKIKVDFNLINSTFFNIFLFNNINFKNFNMNFNLNFNKKEYFSILKLNTDNLEINNFKLGNIVITNKNQREKNNILNSSIEINRIANADNFNLLLKTKLENDIINCNINYLKNLSNILIYKFKIIKDNNNFVINFNNKDSFLQFKNTKLTNNGKIEFNSFFINFIDFIILDQQKENEIISINGIKYYDIYDQKNNITANININNLKFKDIFKTNLIINYKNLQNNIFLKINLNEILIKNKDFNNIICSLNYNKNENIIDLNLKQSLKEKIFLNTKINLTLDENKTINIFLYLDNFKLNNFNLFTKKIVDISNGNISGNFYITGTFFKPIIKGNGTINDLSFKINKIGCTYNNGNAELFGFNNNEIRIYSINLQQNKNTCCNLTGSIIFKTLLKPEIFINGKLNNCEVYNITDDKIFINGNIYGNGDIFLKYNINSFNLNTNIDVVNGNIILNNNIVNDNKNINIIDSKLIAFKKYYNSINNKNKTDVSLNINLKIDNNLKIQLIFNKYNQLNAIGNGNINLKFINSSFKINGQYIFTNGNYNFHIYNLFTKTFNIKNGNIFFNNSIKNTKINVFAVTNSYNTSKNNNKNIELNIKLNGFITSPNITYDVNFFNDNNIEIQEKYNLKNFFYILFFDNITNEQINNHSDEILNKIISNFTHKYFKNLNIEFNFKFNKNNQQNFYKNLNFKTSYNYKNIFNIEKNTSFKSYKDLFNNISIKLLFLKNKGITSNIDFFKEDTLKKEFKKDNNNFNIMSLDFNIQRKFY